MVPLADAGRSAKLGGKAAALAQLVRQGFPVPAAWVLPADAFRAFLLENELDLTTPGLAEKIDRGRMPFPLAAPAPCVAVRSSAVDEDLHDSAAAGRYATVLGVAPADFDGAVRTVWKSWIAARAPGQPLHGMSVLVQEMVDARLAGVMFTTNPVSGSWREMVIEAVWGLGEPLVSGHVVPDRYTLSRERQAGSQRSPANAEEAIRSQETELVLERGALRVRPTAAPHARKLAREDVVALGVLGLRVERILGGPQDIEWVQDRAGHFHVLQARPITTQRRLPRGDATLWTRRFIGERFPGGVTPLTWSIVEPALSWFISYPATSKAHLGGEPPLRVVNGHPYVNVTVFRHLAFKAPGAAPPRFMLDFFPPEEEQAFVRRRAAAPDLTVYASIFRTTFAERRWRRFRWNPATNVRAWDQLRAGLPPRLDRLLQAPIAGVLDQCAELLRDYIKVHVTSLLFANMSFELLGPTLDEAQRALILRPWGGSITRRVDAALGDVGRGTMTMAAFMAEHGHRSRASWEIWAPRLVEDEAGTWETARDLARRLRPDVAAEAKETADAVRALGPLHRRLAHLASEYLRLREEQRYVLDAIFWAAKRRLQALAPTLGVPEELLPWLTRSELVDLPADAVRRAEQRRRIGADPRPPDFFRGDIPLPPPPATHRLQGLGVSPGTARGTARVLHSAAETATLRAGEILVTHSTDPAWTPVFARAAGLVLELGSQLSHGAVVAREYQLPAVANISGATTLIPDGAEIVIDGRSGTVWVL